jgi:predicted RNA-binding Zn ribbon-like protein
MAAGNTDFRFDGGATWLNLLATQGLSFGPHPVERLPDPQRLADWLAAVGLSPARAPVAADLDRTREVREALRRTAMSTLAEEPVRPEDVRLVQDLADAAGGVSARVVRGRLTARAPGSPEEALGRIAQQALTQLTGPERAHLRECADVQCRWIFADPSGRRQYCPSPACGNRSRVRAYRARTGPAAD